MTLREEDTASMLVAVVLAGGSGARLQHDANKVYLPVGGRPLLGWSLRALEQSSLVDQIVLVIRAADRAQATALLAAEQMTKVGHVVTGGDTRNESELAGIQPLATDIIGKQIDHVLIHDGARPFVSEPLLQRLVEGARKVGGAIPGLPLEERIYRRTDRGVAERVPVEALRRVQTPQVFRAEELLQAYVAAESDNFHGVDTSQTVMRYTDLEVAVIHGDPRNVKVTFAEDLQRADAAASAFDPAR